MIVREAGYLMLGSRLKRMGEKVLSEVRAVYSAAGVDFETSWFPVFYVLEEKGSCSIQEMSSQLDVSHSAISQIVSQMKKRGLITLHVTQSDQRRKEIQFTARGEELMQQVKPIWVSFDSALSQHMSQNLLPLLTEAEAKLEAGLISKSAMDNLHLDSSFDLSVYQQPTAQVRTFLLGQNLVVRGESPIIVIRQRDQVRGVLAYKDTPEEVLILDIFVDPIYRRRGYARKMLTSLIDQFPEKRLRVDRITHPVLQVLSVLNHPFIVHPINQE